MTSGMWQGGSMRTRRRRAAALAAILIPLAGCGWLSQSVPIQEAFLSPDGRVVALVVDTCGAELTAEFTEDLLSVSVLVLARSESGDDCGQVVEIEIEEPLGDRRLIDRYGFSELEVSVDPELGPASGGDSGDA